MLTSETKRKIDNARQVLVGKVPNPAFQIDQITNALIYKFMDDMDEKSRTMGGEATFFVGELEPYAWSKLMSPALGAQEKLNKYSEALEKFSNSENLPKLFRDIFRQAHLPYRDPQTLNLFLKEIDYFDYNHSEELGNAFEYLLSIMGSQGDAGMFRTPRHIIDFIVDVVNPTKDDTILDPACGTAGFLISAYKHIMRNHDGIDNDAGGKTDKEKRLTHAEKVSVMEHLQGYDISPEMAKLARVNMYLHGAKTPNIAEYDTLSSDKNWDEYFDVILANPPFMTPKGGVMPHNRFSVQSNRAEVLFVDYIMNHLKPKGRAGIIVPEGIIFKTDTATKQLRKNLVNDGLFAVVSLPAGVFNPYAGVKTSILFFDNEVAKKTKDLLFVKVTNDGYDLGAQRRKIEKDDLGDAGVILKGFREYIRKDQNKETIESFISGSGKGFIVSKEKIKETGDYNLSSDKYKLIEHDTNQIYPLVKIEDLVSTITPPLKIQKNEFSIKGKYPIIDQSQDFISGWTDNEDSLIKSDKPLVIFGDHTCAVKFIETPFAQGADGIKILKANDDLLPEFLYFYLKNKPIESDGYKRHFSKLRETTIPLPPLDVQKEIVEQIEVKQKAIEGAKQVIENLERERRYFGQSLRKLEGVEMLELGQIAEVTAGQSPEGKYYNENREGVPFYQGKTEFEDKFIGEPRVWTTKITKLAEAGDILMSVRAPVGPVNLVNEKVCIGRGLASIRPKNIDKTYIFNYLRSIQDKITGNGGAVFDSINKSQIEKILIPVVSTEKQKEIVEKINIEEEIIQSNKELIKIMEKKIDEVLSEI